MSLKYRTHVMPDVSDIHILDSAARGPNRRTRALVTTPLPQSEARLPIPVKRGSLWVPVPSSSIAGEHEPSAFGEYRL